MCYGEKEAAYVLLLSFKVLPYVRAGRRGEEEEEKREEKKEKKIQLAIPLHPVSFRGVKS